MTFSFCFLSYKNIFKFCFAVIHSKQDFLPSTRLDSNFSMCGFDHPYPIDTIKNLSLIYYESFAYYFNANSRC